MLPFAASELSLHCLDVSPKQVSSLKRVKICKVNENTFKGSKVTFPFGSHYIGGQLFKARICSFRSKFFPSRIDLFGSSLLSRKANRQARKSFLLFKLGKELHPYILYSLTSTWKPPMAGKGCSKHCELNEVASQRFVRSSSTHKIKCAPIFLL